MAVRDQGVPGATDTTFEADDATRQAAWEDRFRNSAWVDEHWAELEDRYAGHWRCVEEAELVIAESDHDRFLSRKCVG